jgi:hypothetical protein
MKTKFPSAVSLTRQQINWLKQQPNGSELIGKIIDALMTLNKFTPESFHSVQLHLTLQILNEKLFDARTARNKLLRDNEWHFKTIKHNDGIHINYYIENPENPTPIDNDGCIIKCLLADYDTAINQMQNEIQKLTAELLQIAEQQAKGNSPSPNMSAALCG